MKTAPEFVPLMAGDSGVVTWIHLGDLHMVQAGEQNYLDLLAMVKEINEHFANRGVSFVYLPGDVADDGSRKAYGAVRACLDQLQLPWIAAVGDHDVHERSFANFESFMSATLCGAFDVGQVRFFRLNAFSEPRPDSFVVDDGQLDWLEAELQQSAGKVAVVLMHCYPSDLKRGGERLSSLLRRYGVRLVGMGHTHYNEISNDGRTLYSATRSTGQIEEGPVGYTVISVDGEAVSWHFVRLGSLPLVSVTSPCDERLLTEGAMGTVTPQQDLQVRVRAWGEDIRGVELEAMGLRVALEPDGEGLWRTVLPAREVMAGVHSLRARAVGAAAEDEVRVAVGAGALGERRRAATDQENALGAWAERDLLGTQLGPNKNGRKW